MKNITIIIIIIINILTSCENNVNKKNNYEDQNSEIMQEKQLSKTDSIKIQEKKDFLTGRFNPETHIDFDILENKYHSKNEMFLQKETINAFIRMKEEAQKDGINLTIVSGTRNFYYQKGIWERKYTEHKEKGLKGKEIIKEIMIWSSMPSTSRHHWGTDIDINGFNTYFNGENEKANKEYEWLKKNAHKFGFCQVYSEKNKNGRNSGYNEEKWHWSYLPIAKELLEDYKKFITYKDINDFSGSEYAEELNIIEEYVYSISKECK